MKVWNVYDDEIREIAAEVGLKIHGDYRGRGIRRIGNAYQFRLKLGERREDGRLRFQRLSSWGRPTHGVCWHGHREFFFALFRRFPEARIKTGIREYRGRRHFKETYRETMGLTVNGWEGVHRDSGCVCNPPPVQDQPDPAFAWTPLNAQPINSFQQSTNAQAANTAWDQWILRYGVSGNST